MKLGDNMRAVCGVPLGLFSAGVLHSLLVIAQTLNTVWLYCIYCAAGPCMPPVGSIVGFACALA
jgi:hypothetical protein